MILVELHPWSNPGDRLLRLISAEDSLLKQLLKLQDSSPGGAWKPFDLDLGVSSELSAGGIYLSLFWWFLCFGVMEDEGGSSPIPDLNAFKILTALRSKRKLTEIQQTFVKKLENIPSVALPVETCQIAINIADRGLIG